MRIIYLILMFSIGLPVFSQTRSFNQIFPGLSPQVREAAFSREGYYRTHNSTQTSVLIGSGRNSVDPQLIQILSRTRPGFMVESIIVIPGRYTILDAYNALGRTRSLAGRMYHSHRQNDLVPLFEEVTRIESERRNTVIADPPPASSVPSSETFFLRLKDVNFGNSFYRGEIARSGNGMRYSLTNFRNLTYMMVPVIREEKFSAQLYFEPIAEGMLVYGLAGADVSDFVSSRINMPSAIHKRLAVIMSWVTDGITRR